MHRISNVLAVAASLANIFLAIELVLARAELHHTGVLSPVSIGQAMPAIQGADLSGEPRMVDYGGSEKTVLYVFTPSCSYCQKNHASIQRLTRELRGRARVVGVSLDRDGLFDWAHLQRPEYDLITDLSYHTFLAYRFAATPTTMVLSPSGVLEKIWTGAYTGPVLRDIESYFAVSLPQAEN